MPPAVPLARPLPVVVFGDGEIPEILLVCLQFRLVAAQLVSSRITASHLMQLARHLDGNRCAPCRRHLDLLRAEHRAVPAPR